MIIDEGMGSPGEGPGVSPDHYAMEDEGEAAICKNTLPTTHPPAATNRNPRTPLPSSIHEREPSTPTGQNATSTRQCHAPLTRTWIMST